MMKHQLLTTLMFLAFAHPVSAGCPCYQCPIEDLGGGQWLHLVYVFDDLPGGGCDVNNYTESTYVGDEVPGEQYYQWCDSMAGSCNCQLPTYTSNTDPKSKQLQPERESKSYEGLRNPLNIFGYSGTQARVDFSYRSYVHFEATLPGETEPTTHHFHIRKFVITPPLEAGRKYIDRTDAKKNRTHTNVPRIVLIGHEVPESEVPDPQKSTQLMPVASDQTLETRKVQPVRAVRGGLADEKYLWRANLGRERALLLLNR